MRYTIQFSILMLCAKYQEAGLCGSREKCDRIFLWRRRRRKTTQDDRSDPYMSPPLKRAGDTMKNDYWLTYVPYQGKSRTGISLSNICTIDNIYHSLLTFSLRCWTQAGTVIKQHHDLLLLNYAKMKGCIMSSIDRGKRELNTKREFANVIKRVFKRD